MQKRICQNSKSTIAISVDLKSTMTISVDQKSMMTIRVDLKSTITIRPDIKSTKTISVNIKSLHTQHRSTTVFVYPILFDHGLFIIRRLNWGRNFLITTLISTLTRVFNTTCTHFLYSNQSHFLRQFHCSQWNWSWSWRYVGPFPFSLIICTQKRTYKLQCKMWVSDLGTWMGGAKRPHGENLTLAEGNKRTRKIQYQLINKIELQLDHNAISFATMIFFSM